MRQIEFDFPTGQQLKEQGIAQAINSANRKHEGWSDKAYDLFKEYLAAFGSTPFMCENVRSYAALIDFPLPPSARSWGGIIKRAKENGLIKSLGIDQVSNPLAHSANAGKWVRA